MNESGAVPVKEKKKPAGYAGYGGWLALFQGWMFIFILIYFIRVEEITNKFLLSMSLPDAISFTAYLALLLLAVACMSRFYKGRLSFRVLYMVFFGLVILFEVIPAFIVVKGFDWFFEAVLSGTGIAIAAGLIKSMRVKNTFEKG